MFKIFFRLLVFLLGLRLITCGWFSDDRPEEISPINFYYYQTLPVILNMSSLFCKDSLLKLRFASNIQDLYKGTVDYELGIVAGAIIDKFTHMMNIYRHYSKPGNYQDTEIEISKMMDGYAAIRGYYNQIVLDRNFYVNLLEKHFEKKEKDTEKFRPVAEKHNVSLDDLAEAMEKGLIKEEDLPTGRRMQPVTTLNPRIHTQGYKVRANRKTTRKLRNMNWTSQNNEAEAQFKKGLRYKHWAERWRGFNPDIEGVHIPKPIADIGFANHSNFLPKEIKGYI